ncbi:unnamed protein product [Bursaphelenchus okinawaensis]|uniref:Uncharacterized protein n=1 Tax=Bursaphelenchus okinawaensis TaxID=465554 RepID=A0A811LCR7_9BILA|nr:unnamed protein product [Bursaphelenchus okinawaensis]CAG9121523.1 unnamed protein product [Bursaphelenchus okinawaensis]
MQRHVVFMKILAEKSKFEPSNFDVVPLIVELVCIVMAVVSFGIFELLYRQGIFFKEDSEGPTKIHMQHLQEYKKQEDKFLSEGGQANPVRQRERKVEVKTKTEAVAVQ